MFFPRGQQYQYVVVYFFQLGMGFHWHFHKTIAPVDWMFKKKKRFSLVRQGPNNSNDAGEKRLRPIAHCHKCVCVCVRVFAFSLQWQSWAVSSGFNHERFYNGSLIPSSRTARADKINPALLRIETINHLFSLNSTESLWQVRKNQGVVHQVLLFLFLSCFTSFFPLSITPPCPGIYN